MDVERLVRDPAYFMEELCVVPSGPFRLEKWQRKILKQLVDVKTGKLKKRFLILCLSKKLGKTTFSSLLMLWQSMRKADSLILLVAGGSKQQSEVLAYSKIKYAIQNGHPFLRQSFRIYNDRIESTTGGIIRVAGTRGQSAAGVELDGVLLDEVWAMSDQQESLFSELISPPPTLRECLTIVSSYPGLGGADSLLGRLVSIAPKNKNMLLLHSHNPRLSSWITKEYVSDMKEILLPTQFRRLFRAEFVDPESAFLNYDEQWLPIVYRDLKPLAPDRDRLIWVGVDAALKRDSAAVVAVYQDGDDLKLGYCRVFTPRRGKELNIDDTLVASVKMLNESFTIAQVLYDARYFKHAAQQLERDPGITMVEVSQSRQAMAPVTENLRNLILSARLAVFPSELDKHIKHCAISEHNQGTTLAPLRRGLHIDGIVALSLATWGAHRHNPTEIRYTTVYPGAIPQTPTPTSMGWTRQHRQPKRGGGIGSRIADLIKDSSR